MVAIYSIGVKQGRLSPPEEGRFQAFPRCSWRNEFERARDAGFSHIEWIHDDYGRDANPIFSASGLAELDALKQRHGIATPALCCDWFMEFPLIRCRDSERHEREQHLRTLFPIAQRMGACRMVLPFVDNARMVTADEQRVIVEMLLRTLPLAERHLVEIHLETDLNPDSFSKFLGRIEHPLLKVTWDSGNSSGLGYVASEEFAAYGARIGSIHIKDRYRSSEGRIETRPLGTGSADFDDIFSAIRSVGYTGSLTLEVARGAPDDELNFLRGQVEFLQRYL